MIRQIYREANKPEAVEKVTKTGLVEWGDGKWKNVYPQFLMGLYYDNPIHGGIINQKVKFITSGGIDTELPDKTLLDNPDGVYSMNEIGLNLCRDFEIIDTWCIVWRKNLRTGKWVPEPMDSELVRATENGVYFEYSENWLSNKQSEKENWRLIKSIEYVSDDDTECLQRQITRPKQRLIDTKKTKRQLTCNYYPAVEYSGAITDILSSIEMSYFTYSEVVNGWKGGTLINLANGIPEDEKRDALERDIKDMATDRDTQGGIAVTFSDGKEREPSLLQINGNDLDKRYDQAKKTARDAILVAHGVISPSLFAVFTESLFGSKEEMEVAYDLFKENYVADRQKNITEPLNWAWEKLNKVNPKFFYNEYRPSFGEQIDADSNVANSINGMSPLVANKVLENLTINEIRALARLAPIEGGDQLPAKTEPVSQFSKQNEEDAILSGFAKSGISRDSKRVLKSSVYSDYSDNEQSFKQSYLGGKFQDELSDTQRQIVTMIGNGEGYGAIKNATGLSSRELSNELIRLKNLGMVDGWNVTEKGQTSTLTEAQLQVLYSYELKPDAPPLVPGGKSRPFCKALVDANRLYTREEITAIGLAVGRDVWAYRGGWYHNPDTDRNTPSCRHTWMQHIAIDL